MLILFDVDVWLHVVFSSHCCYQDHLSEQRLPVTEGESLLDIITHHCNTVQFDIQLAQELIGTQVQINDLVSHFG